MSGLLPYAAGRFRRWLARPACWFWLTTLLFATYLLRSDLNTYQPYDAGAYWRLTNLLYNDGHFSLYCFDSQLRGYLFPLLYVPVLWLSQHQPLLSEVVLIKLVGAALAGLLFGLLLPRLWQQLTGLPAGAGSRLLLIGASFVLWRDYFAYILTDFPTVAALAGALLLTGRLTAARVLGAGALVAATIYMRPIYLAILPPAALLLLTASPAPQHRLWRAAALLLAGLAFALVALPQRLINERVFCLHSWMVRGIEEKDPVMMARGNLYLVNASMGLYVQKYETNIGSDYPEPGVRYLDAAGLVLSREAPDGYFASYGQYLALVGRHPLAMSGLLLRHLFNGLDVLYPTPYLTRLYRSTAGLAWLNYTLLFGGLAVAAAYARRLRFRHWLVLATLLAPVVMAIPLPIECRYALPLHLLLLALACFGGPLLWTRLRQPHPRLLLGAAYLTFLLLCFYTSDQTQRQLAGGHKRAFKLLQR